jgi:Protein of unknown function (DUF1572)
LAQSHIPRPNHGGLSGYRSTYEPRQAGRAAARSRISCPAGTTTAQLQLDDTLLTFQRQKELAERALAQVTDDDFFRTIDAEANSIAVLVKHVGGNLQSRWTDFLTTDGEKPSRDRDGEFVVASAERAAIMSLWDAGWLALSNTFAQLRPGDLIATVTIRGEAMTALAAIHRGLAHISQHVGQIVLLAKHYRSAEWQTLSIPRGRSRGWQPADPTKSR